MLSDAGIVGKTKSVVLTDEGLRRSKALFMALFARAQAFKELNSGAFSRLPNQFQIERFFQKDRFCGFLPISGWARPPESR